ncbi:MAG: ATP phosphoribosyltransferase, partial [Pseudomonadota bacterium]|nr:ATP phosphoribosyltransferase [Pseudomonadota bacterium]
MSPDRSRLHIALQKSGRLADQSRQLLKAAGLKLSEAGKNHLTARAENFPLDLMFVRDDDIPTFVADGVCELGIVGQNVLEEYALGQQGRRFEEVARLGFGRCSLKIAAPDSLNFFNVAMLAGQRIATSYPHLLERFLAERGISAEIVTMRGAVELAPRLGIARFICDLVSTGATLEANGLAPVADVFDSEAVLVRTSKPIDA